MRQLTIQLLLELHVVIEIVLQRQARPEKSHEIFMSNVGERIMFDYCTPIFLCYITLIQQILNWNATPKLSAYLRLVRSYSTECLRPRLPSSSKSLYHPNRQRRRKGPRAAKEEHGSYYSNQAHLSQGKYVEIKKGNNTSI
jgi:hypothetical protein